MNSGTIADYRSAMYEVAEVIAPTWERRRAEVEEVSRPVREWMVRELGPRDGDTVLELAAGLGETGFDAGAMVGHRGHLISSDFSPAMLDAARRRGAERSVGNVEYRVIDAERIELDDDSVDHVLCRFGYMLMADPAAALAETRRVLRPGGRLTLAVWGPPEQNPFFAILGINLTTRGLIPPPEPPPAPGLFNMASAERTTALLHGAGFVDVRTEEVPVRFRLRDLDEYIGLVADTAGPLGLALRGLSDPELANVKAEVEESFGRFAAGTGYRLPGLTLCALAS
jgi:ubiquinone/menaquinone biosynthesis C-methylase UbiE